MVKPRFGIGVHSPHRCRNGFVLGDDRLTQYIPWSAVVEDYMVKIPEDEQVVARCAEPAQVPTSAHDAIIGLTPLSVINGWNPAAVSLYGYAAEEIIGGTTDVLIAPERRAEAAEVFRRVIQGEPAEQHDTERIRKDGSAVSVSVTISPIVDIAGAVVGALMVSRRLDEPSDEPVRLTGYAATLRLQADADTELLEAHSRQAQRLEVLGQLAGGVAHDFNNLLAVILNYASFVSEELIADSPSDWDRRRCVALRDVGQIQRAAERATDMTHQLLAFAHRNVIQPRVLNLNDAVSRVEAMLRRAIGEDIELVTNLHDDLWPILTDPGQIEQVLVNLAINARDAMPGGGTLRIDTANVVIDAESVAGGSPARLGRHVRLRVSDTGAGMPADVITHAFEPFFTTKAHGAGSGLGLATVYGIVTQAEATITIHSEPGVGTTFTILLPTTDQTPATVGNDPTSYQRTPKGETILVVEDQEALREVTERIFTRKGYHVLTAANGPEALAVATRHEGQIHLLVTDVMMPKMLGTEVAERIRLIKPDIEVLYMSGYAQPVLASRGALEPGVALLDKPFSEDGLLSKAGLVLDGHFRKCQTVPS